MVSYSQLPPPKKTCSILRPIGLIHIQPCRRTEGKMAPRKQTAFRIQSLALALALGPTVWGQSESALRLLNRHAPSDQSGRGHHDAQRASHPATESLPGERPFEEHRHADRAVAERRDRARVCDTTSAWWKPTRPARTSAQNAFAHSPPCCRNWRSVAARLTKISVTKRSA